MPPPKAPISAPALARRVLLHPRGGVNKLLELVKHSETEWLELKASFYPEGGNFEQGTNADDYRWNVAKAVIALANSIGGVLLLGVTDDGGVVGIEASDPKGRRRSKGAEAFRREVVMQQVLCPIKGWRTGRQGNFRLENAALLERLISLEEIPHGEKSVLAIFVDPVPEGYGFVEIEASKDVSRRIYLRKRGAVGQVVALNGNQADVLSTHDAQRSKLSVEIPLLWRQFEEGGLLARTTEELVIDVRRHVAELEARLAPVASQFIPLVAVQRHETKPQASGKAQLLDDRDNWVRRNATHHGGRGHVLRSAPEPLRGPATELLGRTSQALLIGEGGSGKSRCLSAFAYQLARDWKPGQPWPLLVSLSDYSVEGLAGMLATESGIDWQDLVPQIGASEVTLCLDGLNECPDLFYEQCLTEIAGILREYPAARVLLTSRSAQLPPELKLAVFELQAMDRACQSQFLATYLEQPQKAESILEQLHLHDGGRAIAGSPMLLRIAAEVARETDEIPVERSKLYGSFLDAWFRRETEKSRHGGKTLPWDHELTINALAELAFQTRKKGSGRIPLPQAEDLLIHRLGEDTERFIDWASQGTVLTRNESRGEVAFEHETIQEYLCARHLAARHADLHSDVLAVRADAKPGIWAMPLAFTFEMLAKPSPAFVTSAWRVEPLIVAAGFRGELHYHANDVANDLWEEAVLNVLLGKDPAAQARAISIIARLPPKYPISHYLLRSLNSHAFWYAALTHAAGVARVDRLRRLVSGPDFPWIELLADSLVGCKALAEDLSPALRAIAGVSPSPTLDQVLSSCSVSELCALRRRKMISAETFVGSWQTVLDRSSADRLDLDLLDILRTEKEQVNDVLQDMLPRYRAPLRRLAVEPALSLRVLSILLRGGVVQAEELRERHGFLTNVCARMSIMNAIRLARQGLLRPGDIDTETKARLIYDRRTTRRNIDDAIKCGLLTPEDLPTQLRKRIVAAAPSPTRRRRGKLGEAKFSVAMLSNARSRMKVNAELANTRWTVELKRIIPERGFGFARHPDFDQDIFCLLSKIAATDWNGLREGKELNVRITTSYDKARQRWSFAVESGHIVD